MTIITTKVACQATPGADSYTISLNHQCLASHIDCHHSQRKQQAQRSRNWLKDTLQLGGEAGIQAQICRPAYRRHLASEGELSQT